MSGSFSTVGLIGRRRKPQVIESLARVADFLTGRGIDVVIEDRTASLMGQACAGTIATRTRLGELCDLIVVVGGDGSLLGVARELAHSGIPMIGVNRGRLGFLADIHPEQIERKLSEVLAGDYRIEEHFLLDARVARGDQVIFRSPALNDVVVHLGGMARMMEFSLWVDDRFVYEQRSDGLIIASPTGSTAYALSAGGPIMHPGLDAIVIVPMFPHTLTSRPLVVRGNAQIRVTAGRGSGDPEVSCDSQVEFNLEPGDTVHIAKYAHPLRLVYPPGHSFYESCRSKLDWASRLGNDVEDD